MFLKSLTKYLSPQGLHKNPGFVSFLKRKKGLTEIFYNLILLRERMLCFHFVFHEDKCTC